MIKEYFLLQFTMLNRQLKELGIEPLIGCVVGFVVFFGVSGKLFEKTPFAEYLYVLLALSLILKLNEVNRNIFLKLCFSKNDFHKVRIIENLFVSFPFFCFLFYQEKFVSLVLLLFFAVLLALISFKNKSEFILPTPFYKYPFEFTIGFRENYFLYFLAYFLTFMSIRFNNFNLGIFSLIVSFVLCFKYYMNSEDKFYVWIFSLNPKEFIRYKIFIILLYSTILSLPIIISLGLFFYTKIDILLSFQAFGYLFLFTVMLAKYSVFPEKMNIRFGIVLALIVWIPPLLVLVIPYLYIKSINKLKEIL